MSLSSEAGQASTFSNRISCGWTVAEHLESKNGRLYSPPVQPCSQVRLERTFFWAFPSPSARQQAASKKNGSGMRSNDSGNAPEAWTALRERSPSDDAATHLFFLLRFKCWHIQRERHTECPACSPAAYCHALSFAVSLSLSSPLSVELCPFFLTHSCLSDAMLKKELRSHACSDPLCASISISPRSSRECALLKGISHRDVSPAPAFDRILAQLHFRSPAQATLPAKRASCFHILAEDQQKRAVCRQFHAGACVPRIKECDFWQCSNVTSLSSLWQGAFQLTPKGSSTSVPVSSNSRQLSSDRRCWLSFKSAALQPLLS